MPAPAESGLFFASGLSAMAELEAIAETLKRQRRDLEELLDSTSSRRDETSELVEKIADLRRRSEETLRRFQDAADDAGMRRP